MEHGFGPNTGEESDVLSGGSERRSGGRGRSTSQKGGGVSGSREDAPRGETFVCGCKKSVGREVCVPEGSC